MKDGDNLSRITKDPEERREEIIETAHRLFEEKGYEQTMMSDISQALGISQGLPYRYFRSKLDLLDAVATKLGKDFVRFLTGYKFKPGMNAKEKLDEYFKIIEDIGSTKLVSVLHRKNNSQIHSRISQAAFKSVMPQLIALIEEGNRQKVFDCPHVAETAAFLLYGAMSIHDTVDHDNMHEKMDIIRELFYRVLGVK
ncbi:MAG: helix-turn-helix domain-containing protein [Acetivibrionales bacterium]|jgi:AcrR family transcriptional regulator|nr:helix-turn-helix domain-containing protein [Bacillota bacterium]NLP08735.1 helix-turn-helix transcriptional regulator [Clostridiaceae bacterium]HPZ04775.1 helix-turn-helix domain-containing protein [Clostridiales bacterium]